MCLRNNKHPAMAEAKRSRTNTGEDKIRHMQGRGQIMAGYG